MWNVEAKNKINGEERTVAVGFQNEKDAQEYADKKNAIDEKHFGLEKFYVVKIK